LQIHTQLGGDIDACREVNPSAPRYRIGAGVSKHERSLRIVYESVTVGSGDRGSRRFCQRTINITNFKFVLDATTR